MDLVYKDLFNQITNRPLVTLSAVEIYEIVNEAIEEINAKGFFNEVIENLGTDSDDVINLTDATNQILDVKMVRDYNLNRMKFKETGGEYISKFASDGELVYEQIGDKLYVKPEAESVTSTGIKAIAMNKIQKTTSSYSWVNKGYTVGMKVKISGFTSTNNNGIFTISKFGTTAEPDDTMQFEENTITDESDGDTVTVSPAYQVICNEALSKFPSTYSSSASITVKESFVPAIRYLTLAKIYEIIGTQDAIALSVENRKLFEAELANLFKNEQQYKEKR